MEDDAQVRKKKNTGFRNQIKSRKEKAMSIRLRIGEKGTSVVIVDREHEDNQQHENNNSHSANNPAPNTASESNAATTSAGQPIVANSNVTNITNSPKLQRKRNISMNPDEEKGAGGGNRKGSIPDPFRVASFSLTCHLCGCALFSEQLQSHCADHIIEMETESRGTMNVMPMKSNVVSTSAKKSTWENQNGARTFNIALDALFNVREGTTSSPLPFSAATANKTSASSSGYRASLNISQPKSVKSADSIELNKNRASLDLSKSPSGDSVHKLISTTVTDALHQESRKSVSPSIIDRMKNFIDDPAKSCSAVDEPVRGLDCPICSRYCENIFEHLHQCISNSSSSVVSKGIFIRQRSSSGQINEPTRKFSSGDKHLPLQTSISEEEKKSNGGTETAVVNKDIHSHEQENVNRVASIASKPVPLMMRLPAVRAPLPPSVFTPLSLPPLEEMEKEEEEYQKLIASGNQQDSLSSAVSLTPSASLNSLIGESLPEAVEETSLDGAFIRTTADESSNLRESQDLSNELGDLVVEVERSPSGVDKFVPKIPKEKLRKIRTMSTQVQATDVTSINQYCENFQARADEAAQLKKMKRKTASVSGSSTTNLASKRREKSSKDSSATHLAIPLASKENAEGSGEGFGKTSPKSPRNSKSTPTSPRHTISSTSPANTSAQKLKRVTSAGSNSSNIINDRAAALSPRVLLSAGRLPMRYNVCTITELVNEFPFILPISVANMKNNVSVAIICMDNFLFLRIGSAGKVFADSRSPKIDGCKFKLKKISSEKISFKPHPEDNRYTKKLSSSSGTNFIEPAISPRMQSSPTLQAVQSNSTTTGAGSPSATSPASTALSSSQSDIFEFPVWMKEPLVVFGDTLSSKGRPLYVCDVNTCLLGLGEPNSSQKNQFRVVQLTE